MALIYIRSHSHVKASLVLMRADHLFINKYIRSLLNYYFKTILLVWEGFGTRSYYQAVLYQDIYIYILD